MTWKSVKPALMAENECHTLTTRGVSAAVISDGKKWGKYMEKIQVTIQEKRNFITVSNNFIDHYMPTANGTYVKVYLYLLRCIADPGRNISISEIADCFENTERDILRALDYWERMKLLSLKKTPQGEIVNIELCDVSETGSVKAPTIPSSPVIISEVTLKAPVSSEHLSGPNEHRSNTNGSEAGNRHNLDKTVTVAEEDASPAEPIAGLSYNYTPEELEAFSQDPSVTILLSVIEKYIKRFLKPSDIQLIYGLYSELHFSVELIDHLYGYCTSKKKNHPAYIENVAINWYNAGIKTIDQATTFSAQYNENYNTVMKQFGLNRIPGEPERKMINRWFEQYNFSADIVCKACELSLLNTSQPSFQYTDKILKNWYDHNVTSLEMAEKLSAEHKKKVPPSYTGQETHRQPNIKNPSHNFNEREYSSADMIALEKSLLEKCKAKK